MTPDEKAEVFTRPARLIHTLKEIAEYHTAQIASPKIDQESFTCKAHRRKLKAVSWCIRNIEDRFYRHEGLDTDMQKAARIALRAFQDDEMHDMEGADPAMVADACAEMGEWLAQRSMFHHACEAYKWGIVFSRMAARSQSLTAPDKHV